MTTKAQFPDEQSTDGSFERQEDAFRDWITTDGSSRYPAEVGRYHLYISLACPWACRTLIVRNQLGLQDVISVSVVDPVRDARGWAFREGDGFSKDPINGFSYLSQAYFKTDPRFHGRVTVPVLWDKVNHVIVNNNEDDLCRMFQMAMAPLGSFSDTIDLFPTALEHEQARLSEYIYHKVNNGVYQAGFASSQKAYEKSCRELFVALDELEIRLERQRYLLSERPVEADWRLFCTLVRFDPVYHGHFKCNLRRILDYPNLHGYLLDLYQQPGIAETVNMDHIKRHYYYTHDDINPTRIVPLGPILDFTAPHGRDRW